MSPARRPAVARPPIKKGRATPRKRRPERYELQRGDLAARARALRYTGRWHRVRRWAEGAVELPGFEEVRPHVIRFARLQNGTRVERLASARVRDLDDEEEAYQRGIGLEHLEAFPPGPGRREGGLRRVVITALTWEPEHEFEICDEAAWVTLGWGMTARQAVQRARGFVRQYIDGLRTKTNSRELWYTAIEIKFWTAKQGSTYV